MRVDKWIWAVRMVKSRTQAGEFCGGGRVLINGNKVKPAKSLKINDIVDVDFRDFVKRYKVVGFLEKRVGAEKAAGFFEDLSPEPEKKDFVLNPKIIQQGSRDRNTGRPTKKDRRQRNKFLGY